ncbi:hypothetical protein ACIBG8_35560 [Nonomuraea sp. NPDC050556]|uniref:hypothetical protein n=1 Tax=Nonomuraea sp. NPDC050556 TaxID=3364369 RepID=UPI0037A05EC7
MRIRRAIAAAVIVIAPALFISTPSANAKTTTPFPGECFNLPYFGPWGHADFDFGPDIVKQLNSNGIKLEAIAPVRVKRGNAGLYMPIGWQQDHIDPCRGVYYPGGIRMINEKTGKTITAENFWLRLDGVYFNISSDGKEPTEQLVGTYKLAEFLPGVLTPRPLEGGIGPMVWPFYVGPGWTQAVESLTGFKTPPGQYLGNLNAVVKFLP